jgi:hypothetical protein
MTAALIRGSCASGWVGNSFLRIFSHHRNDDCRQKSVAPAQSGLPPIRTSPV